MHTVNIKPETQELLAAHSLTGILAGVIRNPDGTFAIQLDDEVLAALAALSSDIDEAITLACRGVGHA